MTQSNEVSRVEGRLEIQTFLARLKYAIENKALRIHFQKDRLVDKNRDEKYTNRYTIAKLFPDDDETELLKRELGSLCVNNYIETVKDDRYPKRSDMRVFGKKYQDGDVYIKLRVELSNISQAAGKDLIFIMSFHFSTRDFQENDFPYKKG